MSYCAFVLILLMQQWIMNNGMSSRSVFIDSIISVSHKTRFLIMAIQRTEMDLSKVLESIETNNLDAVRFEQIDLYGVALSKTIPARHFKAKATKGLNFIGHHLRMDPAGNFIEGTDFIDSTSDNLCFPDYDTFRILPWCEKTGRILMEPTINETPIPYYPRTLARRQLDRLKDLGFSLLLAHEHEFTVVHRDTGIPISDDHRLHTTLRNNQHMKFTNQIMNQLPQVGLDVECAISECGLGQFEITYLPSFGIKAADDAHTYRMAIKEIANQHNFMATFMTFPRLEAPADEKTNAVHICHSLWDIDGKKSLMHDPNQPNGLSQIAQHWIAGTLAHAPALAILMSPTINCMSQFQRSRWAPHHAVWCMNNRDGALRIKLTGGIKGAYIENRLGSGVGNPYITLAATVIAGIDGIQRKLPLPEEFRPNAPVPSGTATIPNNVKDGLQALLDDTIVTEALGKEFVKLFTAAKVHEMKVEKEALAKGDTEWERKMYFKYL